jgi:hypothetical protein
MSLTQTNLHVTVWGEGEPVVLVHGSLTGDPPNDDWTEQRPLAEHHQLIMPSRRGFYQSPPAERVVLPGAGHAVQMLGQPFNDRLVAFWESAAHRGFA